MLINKPFSQSCENNKIPILQIIQDVFRQPATIWEIGSGTGQHACFFASQLPHLIWQPTDLEENLPGIHAWRDEVSLTNLNTPLVLDVNEAVWPCDRMDAVFTANTLHIMSWPDVQCMFERLSNYLNPSAQLCIYGPFNYQGNYTSDSNASFDQWLKDRNPLSGIRDFEAVVELAETQELSLVDDHAMPANNRLLIFTKTATP